MNPEEIPFSDVVADSPAEQRAGLSDYLELTKPRLSLLSVVTVLVGYLSARPPFVPAEILAVVLGASLAAGGVAALNQWLESDTDALMHRTAHRPIPSGKIATGSAFVVGGLMCLAALAILFIRVNGMSALCALLTMAVYLGWYTPAKRWSRWSTEIGALAGALPPLIGWSAGEGRITALGWILFGILLLWQVPHFMAIAWIYRDEYALVHFPMLPVRDPSGRRVARWSFVCAVLLFGVSLAPVALHLADGWYGVAAALTGCWLVWRAVLFLRPANRARSARLLFLASIGYLPLVLGALVADRMARF